MKAAREEFESYNVMGFCLEAEKFVDEKLSNWYIRVNRDRFWSNTAKLDDAGKRDKLAAYQTLYTAVTDLCRLLAPVVPFLSEAMWQNLRMPAGAESVHLTDYPTPDENLVDAALSQDMDAVLRIVSLGGAARNVAKQKVRQPLAELRVAPGSDADRRAVERFPGLIADELNVKRVSLHAPAAGPMLREAARLNPKTAKGRYKGKPEAAAAELEALDPAKVRDELKASGRFTLLGVDLVADDLLFETAAPDGWAGVVEKGTQVMIDARVTPELKAEGLARDVVRLVQDARKDARLDVADKIALYLGTESDSLRAAIAAHRGYIAAETQAAEWSDAPLNGEAFSPPEPRKVDGQPLTIALRKV
jgi:isoleucyl-tRNA synthetase